MLEQVEREMAQDGKVLGGVAIPNPTGVLVERDIEHPMQAIFDAPVAPHRRSALVGGQQVAEEIVAARLWARGADAPFFLDPPDGLQTRPVVLILQPGE